MSFCIRGVSRMRLEGDLGRIRVENAGLTAHAVQIGTRRQSLEPEIEQNEMAPAVGRAGSTRDAGADREALGADSWSSPLPRTQGE